MKKMILTAAALLMGFGALAQRNAFVNTEQIFRAIPAYNQAIEQIDQYARQEQEQIDALFAQIAEMYERYQYQKTNLSESVRQQVESNIITLEQAATERQRNAFGQDGTVMTRRIELLKPIQDQVFAAIDSLAQARGCDQVLDISNNPSIVYYNKTGDLTEEVIRSLGITN
jgi:outer membrane protein